MYIDKVSIKRLAAAKGLKYLNAYRRIASIEKKLSKLDKIVEDEDELDLTKDWYNVTYMNNPNKVRPLITPYKL